MLFLFYCLQWDLVCGKTWLISFSSSCYMLGTLVGAGSAGWLSDKLVHLIIILSLYLYKVVSASYYYPVSILI